MSLLCSRLSETSLSILGRQYQGNALIEPIGLRGVPDGLSAYGRWPETAFWEIGPLPLPQRFLTDYSRLVNTTA